MQQGFAATTDWRRSACDEARECGNQQLIHVIGFSLHLVHAAYAIGASHQVAGAPDVGKPTPHPDRGHRRRCDHFRCYRCLQRRQSGVRLVQPQLESALVIAEWPASKPEPLRCARQRHLPCSSCQSTAWQAQPASTATADWRVPRP